MITLPARQRIIGLVLPSLFFILYAGISASGQTPPMINHKADLLKSTMEIKPLLDSTLEELYNPATEQWERSRVICRNYTPDGLELQIFYDCINDADDSRYEYTYNTEGIIIFYYRSVWDTATNQWRQDQKNENTLDTEGNVIQRISYYRDNIDSLWHNLRMYEYTYDAYGNVLQVFFRIWDEGISQWRNYDKTDYARDENENITSYIWQQWNNSNGQWYDAFSLEYTYDAEGREIHLMQYHWDTLAGQWINHYKQDNTWSTEGNLLSEQEWMWDTTFGTWTNYEITEYAYDINGVNSSEIGSYWDTDAGQWIFEYRKTHYYAGYSSTERSEKYGTKIHLFPNPAGEFIMINADRSSCCTRIELYDMRGRKILSRQLEGSRPLVPVSHLKSGTYLYRIYSVERITGKVVVGR